MYSALLLLHMRCDRATISLDTADTLCNRHDQYIRKCNSKYLCVSLRCVHIYAVGVVNRGQLDCGPTGMNLSPDMDSWSFEFHVSGVGHVSCMRNETNIRVKYHTRMCVLSWTI
jgi:hypothetical protein